MSMFDFFKRAKPASNGDPEPEGKCTQPVALETTLDAANGGVEAWFFTLSAERQKQLLVDMARQGIQATHDKYLAQVAIDVNAWPRYCTLFNGTNSQGQRAAGIGFLYYADPAVAQAAAKETFNHAAASLHAAQRLQSR